MRATNTKHFDKAAVNSGVWNASYNAANTNHMALLAIAGSGSALTQAPAFKI
jgi:hypothetical protein